MGAQEELEKRQIQLERDFDLTRRIKAYNYLDEMPIGEWCRYDGVSVFQHEKGRYSVQINTGVCYSIQEAVLLIMFWRNGGIQ